MKNKEILGKLTLEEKATLCTGKDFWRLNGVERLGLPSVTVTDGPHGLSLRKPDGDLRESVTATCFPSAVTTACSWDRELLYRMGQAMGEECLKEKVSVILGPGVNMKRSPLCGRNFEYFSEDPLLAGELAAGLINGIQSKGVGTSLKHFAVNSQEKRRLIIDSVVDERALREIYLTAFEIAVKKAQPWTVMSAYNRVGGDYCTENGYLQNKILRDEWGFEGVVMSDWGAVNNRVKGLTDGCDLEMPSSHGYNTKKICDAVRNGTLDEKYLDIAADRILTLIEKSKKASGEFTYDEEAHHKLAAEICAESAVLLKNEENTLPLSKDKTVAVIGEMARAPRYQGAGSSIIVPTKVTDAFESLMAEGYKVTFAPGYFKKQDSLNEVMVKDACNVAAKADAVLLFIGLTEEYESEGYDRKTMKLPASHNRLAEEILKVNENVTVVLSGGSPVIMPWAKKVKAILNGYLGGQASGKALAEIISGKVNPSGKLAETYSLSEGDVPCSNYYPGTGLTAEHREGVYIGYRYYDTARKNVLFPFGHGLSYTSFEYSDMKLSAESIKDTDTLTVTCKIKNIGDRDGAEAVQLYVKDCESTVFRPEKELRDFAKIYLEKGEEKEVSFTLSKRAFAYYNINISDWHVESGKFEILIGASSRDIRLSAVAEIISSQPDVSVPDYRESAPCYYGADVKNVPDRQYRALLGRDIPPQYLDVNDKFTAESCLMDAEHTKWGKRIITLITGGRKPDPNAPGGDPVREITLESPIRGLYSFGQGVFTEKMAEGLLMLLNEEGSAAAMMKLFSGLIPALKKLPELFNINVKENK
ncbi:MAG: glycoside hydrolase family 3 C-terminal domain-containing protein [Clostridia bacterium]|nr:glycoside hydrolase family 3 C-terminal domain-containing protein [Clostridia bacterium]